MDRVGERIVCLERAFNVREGFRRKDDALPRWMLAEHLSNAGSATGQIVRKLDTLLDEYYAAFGYNSAGLLTSEKLRDLRLDFAISEMGRSSSLSL